MAKKRERDALKNGQPEPEPEEQPEEQPEPEPPVEDTEIVTEITATKIEAPPPKIEAPHRPSRVDRRRNPVAAPDPGARAQPAASTETEI